MEGDLIEPKNQKSLMPANKEESKGNKTVKTSIKKKKVRKK